MFSNYSPIPSNSTVTYTAVTALLEIILIMCLQNKYQFKVSLWAFISCIYLHPGVYFLSRIEWQVLILVFTSLIIWLEPFTYLQKRMHCWPHVTTDIDNTLNFLNAWYHLTLAPGNNSIHKPRHSLHSCCCTTWHVFEPSFNNQLNKLYSIPWDLVWPL